MNVARLGMAFRLLLVLFLTAGARFDPAKSSVIGAGAGDFTFAVLADVQEPPDFRERVGWLSSGEYNFCVIAGDHIRGYSEGDKPLAEWKEFDATAAGFRSPYVMVPGNHDIWNEASEKIWKERYGPPWFSWNHKGAHFVAMNCVEEAKWARIRDGQITWLKKDLEKNKGARATFVFLHMPVWNYEKDMWDEKIHPLLREAGVDFVFAGHEHRYELGAKRDGVQYVMLGPSAAGPNTGYGGVVNYLLVNVTGSTASYRLLTPDGERPVDYATREIRGAIERSLALTPVARAGKKRKINLVFPAENPWKDKSITAVAVLNPGNSTWKAARAKRTLKPGEKADLVLSTKTGKTVMPLPVVTLELLMDGMSLVKRDTVPVIAGVIDGQVERLLDDFSDGDLHTSSAVNAIAATNGHWEVKGDDLGNTKVEGKVEDGALHMTGVRGPNEQPNGWSWAVCNAAPSDGRSTNLGGSVGISFRIRSAKSVPVELHAEGTIGGKDISNRGAGHRVRIEATGDWKTHRFYWHDFKQPSWVCPGDNCAGPLTLESIGYFSWAIAADGVEIDLMLDDVSLLYE